MSGQYWSASADDYNACTIFFTSSYVTSSYSATREDGYSVRLVQNINVNIRFVNADGTTLLDTTVMRGTMPRYNGTPTLNSKAYTLTFVEWEKKPVVAESDMTYTAVYDSMQVFYTSIFKDYDGTPLDTINKCAYDSVTKKELTRNSDTLYSYKFREWLRDESKILSDTLIYTAVYNSEKRNYTRLYYNCDTLYRQVDNCAYDSVVMVEQPDRANTVIYDYEFDSWSLDTRKIAHDTLVCTSVYNTKKIHYTRLYYNYDTLYKQIDNCAYDSTVTVEEPTRAPEQDYTYKFLEWKCDESKISEKQLIYTAVYTMLYTGEESGAILTAYKVSDTKSVYFSKGNLQFNAVQGMHTVFEDTAKVAGTWRFAQNQWDVIGSANNNISSSYDGWIDLFGWGTSGWSGGVIAYQPWATSLIGSEYFPGGDAKNNLTGIYAKADWGVYNAISNGGNEPNKWRTLTQEEWQFLFQNNWWTLGKVEDMLCFMLIPKNFTAPDEITVEVLSKSTTENLGGGF